MEKGLLCQMLFSRASGWRGECSKTSNKKNFQYDSILNCAQLSLHRKPDACVLSSSPRDHGDVFFILFILDAKIKKTDIKVRNDRPQRVQNRSFQNHLTP